jgi:hypothetical protein
MVSPTCVVQLSRVGLPNLALTETTPSPDPSPGASASTLISASTGQPDRAENQARQSIRHAARSYRTVISAWPYSIGKAFRIAESRVNPNARERSEPNRAKCPREVRGVQNERRHCDTKTKRKHAEEDTRPQELICMLLSSLAGCGPRTSRRVENSTYMRKAPHKTMPVTYRISKCSIAVIVKRLHNDPTAAQ